MRLLNVVSKGEGVFGLIAEFPSQLLSRAWLLLTHQFLGGVRVNRLINESYDTVR